MSENNGFIKCDADEAMLLFKKREVKGIFWLNDSGDLAYPMRQVLLSGQSPSDYAVVAGPHPLSDVLAATTDHNNN
jgi:hypothetical protein